MDAQTLAAWVAAAVATVAAVIAIWQAVSAASQARSAKDQADAAELQVFEAKRAAEAAEAQVRLAEAQLEFARSERNAAFRSTIHKDFQDVVTTGNGWKDSLTKLSGLLIDTEETNDESLADLSDTMEDAIRALRDFRATMWRFVPHASMVEVTGLLNPITAVLNNTQLGYARLRSSYRSPEARAAYSNELSRAADEIGQLLNAFIQQGVQWMHHNVVQASEPRTDH